MTLAEYVVDMSSGWKDHPRFAGSVLQPVAPEYTTGEVLLGGTYRKLLLDIRDSKVDLRRVRELPEALADGDPDLHALWDALLLTNGGLRSPDRSGQGDSRQLMPLVPQIAAYANVLGAAPRGRWEPGDLVVSALASGSSDGQSSPVLARLAGSLQVGPEDDILARVVELALSERGFEGAEARLRSQQPKSPLWRSRAQLEAWGGRSPAEQLALDLVHVCDDGFKQRFTRRQWTAMLEGVLRLGTPLHFLWLCRTSNVLWNHALRAIEQGVTPEVSMLGQELFNGHRDDVPMLVLGDSALPAINHLVGQYIYARIGLNTVLHCLEDVNVPWDHVLGVAQVGGTPVDDLHAFLTHVATAADKIRAHVRSQPSELGNSIGAVAGRIGARKPSHTTLKSGPGNNMREFVQHTLARLQVADPDFQAYDQSYAIYKRGSHRGAPYEVRLGSATLLGSVFLCCRDAGSGGDVHATIDDLKRYLANYGIASPGSELGAFGGATIGDLERLGLVVDSADAGAGRLLVDPFATLKD